jgi:hypothetical protein
MERLSFEEFKTQVATKATGKDYLFVDEVDHY